MSGIFNYENKFMTALAKIGDSICLCVFWLICSLPIITLGASTTAFYYAFNKSIRQKRSYAWKEFFHAFKSNFKQSTQIWLLLLGLYILTIADCYILHSLGETAAFFKILMAIIIALIVLMTMWALYLFPYIARFENTTKAIRKNCGLIMIANMPWTILLFVIFAVTLVLFLAFPMIGIFVPALYMVFANRILERVFRKYMTPEELEVEKEYMR